MTATPIEPRSQTEADPTQPAGNGPERQKPLVIPQDLIEHEIMSAVQPVPANPDDIPAWLEDQIVAALVSAYTQRDDLKEWGMIFATRLQRLNAPKNREAWEKVLKSHGPPREFQRELRKRALQRLKKQAPELFEKYAETFGWDWVYGWDEYR